MTASDGPRDGLLLSHAVIATFLRAPQLSFFDLKAGAIAIYGAPTDWTLVTRPGARYGPRAIRETSAHLAWYPETLLSGEMVDVRSGRTIKLGRGDAKVFDLGDVAIYPLDVERTTESIVGAEKAILEAGSFPIMLGGDHFVTYPATRAYLEHLE